MNTWWYKAEAKHIYLDVWSLSIELTLYDTKNLSFIMLGDEQSAVS
jgi:hypothetical protein